MKHIIINGRTNDSGYLEYSWRCPVCGTQGILAVLTEECVEKVMRTHSKTCILYQFRDCVKKDMQAGKKVPDGLQLAISRVIDNLEVYPL